MQNHENLSAVKLSPSIFQLCLSLPMPTHLYVITGASRGLGLAMAEQLLSPGHQLLCISRRPETKLDDQAKAVGCAVEQWAMDLADAPTVSARLAQWLQSLNLQLLESATLINNAGMIPSIVPLRDAHADETTRALQVGLEAPMLLTSAFLRHTESFTGPRKVLNISSGLGRRPMASQAAYCAAKAGMDHFTRCLALDEALHVHGAKVCSLAPGVIDTDMQIQLRDAPAADFPDQANFSKLKSSGQLSTAQDTARQVLSWLNRPDFGAHPVADVRDA